MIVVDIEPLFATGDGSIRFTNENGQLLYDDVNHLSGAGTELVKPYVSRAIKELQADP